MCEITSASYVMMLERAGIYFLDADSVSQSTRISGAQNLRKANYYKRIDGFFDEMFKTWIGYKKAGANIHNPDDLKAKAREIKAKNAILIRAVSIQEVNIELQ
jgi:hypothetical protein